MAKDSPFQSYDPREMEQYASIVVPKGVVIPTTDDAAWEHFPTYRWVYNRLEIALSQGIACAPVGIDPKAYPLFLKPITNLYGGGLGARSIESEEEFGKYEHLSGHFWMEYLTGEHLSHDLVLIDGKAAYALTFRGHSLGQGMFDYWEIIEENKACGYSKTWVEKHLRGYTGCVNIETIGNRIIECHLRMGDIDGIGDPDLMQSIVDAYSYGKWNYAKKIPPFYELALWGDYGVNYAIDEENAQKRFAHLTFCAIDEPINYRFNPVGGVRVAIIGGYDFDELVLARHDLCNLFSPKPRLPRMDYPEKKEAIKMEI